MFSGQGKGDKYEDNSLNLFQYYTSSCYTGFRDDDKVGYLVSSVHSMNNNNLIITCFSKGLLPQLPHSSLTHIIGKVGGGGGEDTKYHKFSLQVSALCVKQKVCKSNIHYISVIQSELTQAIYIYITTAKE